MASQVPQLPAISREIWERKYRFVVPSGNDARGAARPSQSANHSRRTAKSDVDRLQSDLTPDDTMRRVAEAAASLEKGGKRRRSAWAKSFHAAMADFGVLPAGRILAGAGTGRDVTMFNCFVLGAIPDNLSGIFDAVKEAALTMQAGGGIGHDFSTLRPRGAAVRSIGADAAGPVHFMDVWDSMCGTIQSAGQRRGAMMATLRCDHPDIEDFISAKSDPNRLRNFNLSVLVTDAFISAVRDDRSWPLAFAGKTYKTVSARQLWDRIMRATYDYAEPGVIFIDRINRANNLNYCEQISATNPCGEQPLPPYGACLLGSINLAALVKNSFETNATIDLTDLRERVTIAVRLLDNVIDISNYPLPAQRAEAMAKRRIGLGLTGLANALIFTGLGYGTERGRAEAARWMGEIQNAAYLASAELAAEKGTFPLYDQEAMLASENVKRLRPDVIDSIRKHGLRNGCLTSIAPTGTISLLAGNVSSGLEPVFDWAFERRLRDRDNSTHTERVEDFAYRTYVARFGNNAPLTEAFVTAGALAPEDHIAMQAALQPFVDSAISKTINCPEDIAFEDFKNIYMVAFDKGLKGCTTYRPNAVTGAVLSTNAPATTDTPSDQSNTAQAARPSTAMPALAPTTDGVVYMTEPLQREAALDGTTYKIKWPGSEHALYVTINNFVQNGRRRPFEIFINTKSLEHHAWTVALTRMISAIFRRGGNVSFVAEELRAVFDPEGGRWMGGKYVPSLIAAVGDTIDQHLRKIGFLSGDTAQELFNEAIPLEQQLLQTHSVEGRHEARQDASVANSFPAHNSRFCPACGVRGLERIAGCWTCQSCLYTKCQ